MRALWINTEFRTVEWFDLPETTKEFQNKITELVQCDSYFVGTFLESSTIHWIVASDSLENDRRGSVRINLSPAPLFGNIVVLSRNPATGKLTNLPKEVDESSLDVTFPSKIQTSQYRQKAVARRDRLDRKLLKMTIFNQKQ